MTSENAARQGRHDPKTTSENTQPTSGPRRRGRAPVALPVRLEAVHAGYLTKLARAPLAEQTRRTYASKVRGYLAWLAEADVDGDGDPLTDSDARDWAVRDYRTHLTAVLKRGNATVNNALAAVDDFYTRTGLGPARADRLDLPTLAPRALDDKAILRWLRAVRSAPSARDRALALTPFYAGCRIAEAARLDLDDIARSARKGSIRFYGKGGKPREMELHPQLREAYTEWIDRERPDWPGAATNPAVFLNHRGGRLSARAASTVFSSMLNTAGLDDHATAHVLRHTFATRLVHGGTDLVVVADMLGHASLDQIRRYTLPTAADRREALKHLPVDR
jgi:site-specific recombinase XerD